MGADRIGIERGKAQREVVDVAGFRAGARPSGAAQRRVDRDEIDQLGSGAQLDQADLVDSPLFRAAQRIAIEPKRKFQVGHAQDDVIESFDCDRTHTCLTSCASHFKRTSKLPR